MQYGDDKEVPLLSVVGIGSAASRLVNRMAAQEEAEDLRWLAVDADRRILAELAIPVVPLGEDNASFLGGGGDPRRGREWATAASGHVLQAIGPATAALIVVFLGGGVGSGAAPAILSEIYRHGVHTSVLAVMPLSAEGNRRQENAVAALESMAGSADVVIRADASRLLTAAPPGTDVGEAFAGVSDGLASVLKILVRMWGRESLLNISFADLAALAEPERGILELVYCGEDRWLNRTEQDQLELLGSHLSGTRGGVLLFLAGRETPMQRLNTVVETVRARLPESADLKVGAAVDRRKKSRLEVLLLLASSLPGAAQRPPAVPAGESRAVASGPVQEEFVFNNQRSGRFHGLAPTIYAGQDLDIPTFIRRNIRLRGTPPAG